MNHYGLDAHRASHGAFGLLGAFLCLTVAACARHPAGPQMAGTVALASTTPSPAPSRTPPGPTTTVAPTATRQPPKPTPTLAPPPTEAEIDPTAMIASLMTAEPPLPLGQHASPDGQWRADVLRYDCRSVDGSQQENAYEQLTLTNLDTGEVRLVDDELEFCGGLGAFGLAGLYWSRDSRFFYYTDAREGVPDGGCIDWYRPATRLEPVTGEKVGLAQGPQSPTAPFMAGILGQDVVVWSRDAGAVFRAPFAVAGQPAGALAWAPDGRALVYLQWTSYCPQADGQSYVVRLDWPSLEQSVILEPGAVTFIGVTWDAPNRLRLIDIDNRAWRYNLSTRALTLFSSDP